MIIRIDKYLADSGFGTRSEVRSLVKSGSVSINEEIIKDAGLRIDSEKDQIKVRGKAVSYSEYEYYMLHKPAGVITASSDKKEKTVVDLIDSKKRRDLFPVGRLDRDTEGLLLITNDGELAHKLLAPGKHVDKKYMAVISGELPEDVVGQFEKGLDIGDEKPTKPARLKVYKTKEEYIESFSETMVDEYLLEHYEGADHICEIIITEGRYHEIKRMFEAVDCKVEYLKRYSMGKLELDMSLRPGEYKEISRAECGI